MKTLTGILTIILFLTLCFSGPIEDANEAVYEPYNFGEGE